MTIEATDRRHVWHPFSPTSTTPLPVVRAEGAYLYTEDGRAILDAISSWWVNTHGHAHPHIAAAIASQAKELEQVIFAGFTHAPAAQLAERLSAKLPAHLNRLFFSDNGSTATEVALKLVLQYFFLDGEDRHHFLAFRDSYHGDTFGAMALSGTTVFHRPFERHLFNVTYIDLPADDAAANSLAQIEAALADKPVAGMILEPLVLGAGGMQMYSATALENIISRLHAAGCFVVADEVMTGFGRTGSLFACDQLREQPDLMCFSKGLTGGFLPLGLTAVSDRIAERFDRASRTEMFMHGHSFTGNPLACAAANASLDLFEEADTWQNIERISHRHATALPRFRSLPGVKDVRCCGTILAVELQAPDAGYLSALGPVLYDAFLARDVLLRPLGQTLYILPPYVITDAELERLYSEIETQLPLLEQKVSRLS